MPQTEADLYSRVIDINRNACHHRGIASNYGYNAILDIDLVDCCLSMLRRFGPPVRVLDIGCGDGLALRQLSDGLERAGADPDQFELWGMGLNQYDEMFLEEDRFIESGLNAYEADGRRFHIVVSVFTFHYMWHKLEGIEKIYNDLLEEGGIARIHFPGYLIRFGESPSSLAQSEEEGNRSFSSFLAGREAPGEMVPMGYRIVPYYSDDDDCALLAEFGHLEFTRRSRASVSFGHSLRAFALFTRGFKFSRMNSSGLNYVASHYVATTAEACPTSTPSRITSLAVEIPRRTFQVDVAVQARDSHRVVLMCPGACEPLGGKLVDLIPAAEMIGGAGIGAVVRYNDPYDRGGDYADLAQLAFRRVMEFILEHAERFCSTARPKISIMAFSSGAGAAASLAADYPAVDGILLVAPSLDIPRETIEPGLERFGGEVRVVIGSEDNVVLPQQAFWFYQAARSACHREYVEVPSCGHYFEGEQNRARFRESPVWAFGGVRPADFPASLDRCTVMD